MSTTVRRDITTAVNYSARGLSSPNLFHVRLVEQIMVYLYQAKFFGLCYTHNNSLVVTDDVFHPLSRRYCDILWTWIFTGHTLCAYVLFSDANFGDIFDARLRSTTGWCCYVFGCLISWHSRRQSITAKCTLEAELIAAATCSVEGCWCHISLVFLPIFYATSSTTAYGQQCCPTQC